MGFPSPAKYYVERTLTPEIIRGITANSLVIETSDGWAVVERGMKIQQHTTHRIQWGASLRKMSWMITDNE